MTKFTEPLFRDYVKQSIALHPNPLIEKVFAEWRNSFNAYLLVKDDSRRSDLPKLTEGGFVHQIPDEDKEVHGFHQCIHYLKDDPDNLVIFCDPLAEIADPWLNNETQWFTYQKKIYIYRSIKDGEEQVKHDFRSYCDSIPTWVLLSKGNFPRVPGVHPQNASKAGIKGVTMHAELIFLSVFDGEGYLTIERNMNGAT